MPERAYMTSMCRKNKKFDVIIGVPYHWLLFLTLKGISKATVLNVTPMTAHFAKNKLVYVFVMPTNACL